MTKRLVKVGIEQYDYKTYSFLPVIIGKCLNFCVPISGIYRMGLGAPVIHCGDLTGIQDPHSGEKEPLSK